MKFTNNYYPIILLKGMLMGIADLIPGVSGGTIALITGVYKDLISSKTYTAMLLLFIFLIYVEFFISLRYIIYSLNVASLSNLSILGFSLFEYLSNSYYFFSLALRFLVLYFLWNNSVPYQ